MPTDAAVSVERGVPYGPGTLLDVYRPDSSPGPVPTVLLWHGVGPDERDVLGTLATAAAGFGLTVVVPDWRSGEPDGGAAQLLASLAFTRERAAALGGLGEDAIVLAGWSRGGRAAAAVAVRPEAVGGWRPLGVVCLGAAYTRPAPTTGGSPMALPPGLAGPGRRRGPAVRPDDRRGGPHQRVNRQRAWAPGGGAAADTTIGCRPVLSGVGDPTSGGAGWPSSHRPQKESC